ncbi:MAG: AsmA-like C-terminal region-containing protein [Bacteroidales bacterium]|nr:AsmA-like C-terminal region-containing protein [Bacteroidales bacterium]
MGRLFRIILIIVSTLVAFIVGLAIAGYFLEDRIVQYTINQLNQRLTVTLKVKEVKASLISSFPYAGVTLKHVEIVEGSLDTPKEFETGLLSLDEIVVKISLIGIFSNNYSIEKLVLKDGWINLYFDNFGKGNFEIFDKSKGKESNWILDIDKLQLDNINISYIDPRTGWVCKGYVEQGELKGNLDASNISLGIKFNGVVGTLRQGAFQYIRNERLELSTIFELTDSSILVDNGFAKVGKSKLTVDGTVGRGKGTPVELSISGDNLSANKLVLLMSQFNLSLPAKTKTKGYFTFKLSIDGISRVDKPFKINLNYFTKGITLLLPDKPEVHLTDVMGSFSNGDLGKPESSTIDISKFRLKTLNSFIEGSLKLKNINTPLYHLKVEHGIDIGGLKEWGVSLPLIRGEVNGSFEALGMLESINQVTLASFENSKFISSTVVNDIDFETVGRIPDLKGISGEFSIANQDITKAKLKGLLHNANFEAEFRVANAGGILFNNSKAEVQTSIVIDSINSNWLLAENTDNVSVKGVSTWNRIQSIAGDVFIDEFIHNNFTAKPLSASFHLSEDELICNSFLCRTCDGIITGRIGASIFEGNGYALSADVDLDGIDVSNLFTAFNNFEQEIITSHNISGILDGNVVFSTTIDGGIISKKNVNASSNLILHDGRLKNVKQLESLSKFIELQELQDIYFRTLKNTITVTDETVFIPQMEINSSALNLFASGNHKFNGEYLYQVRVKLSDVLFKKSSAQSNQFGVIEQDEDGVKVYLKIEGNSSTHNVSYDRAKAREVFRESLQEERETLKGILQDEFKFLKRSSDTTNTAASETPNAQKLDTANNKKKKPKFIIEWDDE